MAHQQAQAALRAPAAQRGMMARRASGVVCMAHPRRVAKVAKQIEREVGQLLISDKALQAAVCPERRRGYDGALSALASVTEVQLSNDLQVAKVYLSIYSDEVGKATAMEGLQRLEGYVRKHVGKQVRLRLTPEIRFVRDDSIERTERIFKLLDQVKAIERGEAEPPPLAFYGGEEEAWEDEEEVDAGDDEDAFQVVDLGFFDDGRSGQARGGSKRTQPGSAAASRQQQARSAARGGGSSSKEGDLQSEEDMEDMLAAFKQQAERRGWSKS